MVLHRDDDLAWLSLRNVATVHTLTVDQLNAYDVLVSDEVVFTSAALQAYVARSGASLDVENSEELTRAGRARRRRLRTAPSAGSGDSSAAAPYGAGSYVGTEPPNGYDIKGNEDSMKFHTPESPYYTRTIAEVWFNSVEAAEAAGFSNAQGDTGAESDEEPPSAAEEDEK